MTKSANGLEAHDVGRMYELHWVVVDGMFETPVEVVHDTGDRVWVFCTYADEIPEGVVQVGDGLNNGLDMHGSKLVSVPAERCSFIDGKEVEAILRAIEADEELLRFAKG